MPIPTEKIQKYILAIVLNFFESKKFNVTIKKVLWR